MNKAFPALFIAIVFLGQAASPGPARAQQHAPSRIDTSDPAPKDDSEAAAGEFKLTFGRYFVRRDASPDGTDLNLRYRRDDTSWWGGIYRDGGFGTQVRGGYDTRIKPWSGLDVAVLPAVMAASRGFAGGSLALEVGGTVYGQIGLGRTDLKPFANLNFDPNDNATAALGYRPDGAGNYTATIIRDNRTGTGQQDVHLTGQWTLPTRQRLTLDLLHKQGLGDGGYVRGNGFTATVDFPHWFTRLAYDPKQNFSRYDVLRLSVGLWF